LQTNQKIFSKIGNIKNIYIATQGPLENTIGDFWEMIKDKNVYNIIMLGNIEEDNIKKCEKYWPSPGETLNVNNMEISCLEFEENDYIVRKFKMLYENETRIITQFHYTNWNDHQTPDEHSFLNFLLRCKSIYECPILVHCSAGIGRTGVFLATHSLINDCEGSKMKSLNIFSTILTLRKYRQKLVQTPKQYLFCYEIIEKYLKQIL